MEPDDLIQEREAAADHLVELFEVRISPGARRRSPFEARESWTMAYVALIFAIAVARLGQAPKAKGLWEQGERVLRPLGDAIHDLLLDWLNARFRRGLEGMRPHFGAEAELLGRHNALKRFARYKVERLRQASRMLDPGGDLLEPVLLELAPAVLRLGGRDDKVRGWIRGGLCQLTGWSMQPFYWLPLTEALARTFGELPWTEARSGIEQLVYQLPRISDSFNTNSHFCVSVVAHATGANTWVAESKATTTEGTATRRPRLLPAVTP